MSEPRRSISGNRKSQKKKTVRLPSYQLPAGLRATEDAQDDAAAPSRDTTTATMPYMNQSIFGIFAAAGSTTDFSQRFDESSESDSSREQEGKRGQVGRSKSGRHSEFKNSKDSNSKKKLSLQVPTQSTHLSSKAETHVSSHETESGTSPVDSDEEAAYAPMMSRLLTAEAKFEAREGSRISSSAESSPATLLATRLQEIFGFERPETVMAEYPCWLLQSVLLQGYLYVTRRHICFYAYLPKKANLAAKTGHLSKRGKNNTKYRRYWFELKGDVLSYYSGLTNRYFPNGNIDLRYGISASVADELDKDCHDFSVTTDHRTYYFRADSTVSAREWVKIIQRTIFRSHNDGDSIKIALPMASIIDIEDSPVVNMAETIKIRMVESDDSYAIDEYFFSFSHGVDVMRKLLELFEHNSSRRASMDTLRPARTDTKNARKPVQESGNASQVSSVLESGRAIITPYIVSHDVKMAPRRSGESSRPGPSSSGASVKQAADSVHQNLGRGRPSTSGNRADSTQVIGQARSPLARASTRANISGGSPSTQKGTDTANSPASIEADIDMSASQILTRSDVFKTPPIRRMSTLQSTDNEDEVPLEQDPTNLPRPAHDRTSALQAGPTAQQTATSVQINRTASPTLQDIVKAGSAPIYRAGAFAGYLKNRSERMSKLLATESMSYLEKVSGMWAGQRKHYGDNEAVLSDDRDVDEEDEEANVGHGDRFRAHFALPATEKLQATFFGFLHRVLPLYGKIYVSTTKFCFRSLLPGTRTKLILPLKDIENVDKEKGFRFGYHGLVLVIRGYEELFFEFSSPDSRDDCTVTLLKSLESIRYMAESGLLPQAEAEAAEAAKIENLMLQEARRGSGIASDDLSKGIPGGEVGAVLFDDARASIINFKPPPGLRITCLTIGSRGDVQPYIALCKGLLAEGHRPRIATHAEFGPWIQKHGIEFVSIGGDPAELMRICVENGMFTVSFLKEATSKFRTWIDELLESAWSACQDSDILIESPSAMAGIHIAEALGIPYFRAFTMPWTRTRAYPHAFAVPEHKYGGAYNYMSYVMFDNVFWKGISGQINRWRQRDLGLGSTSLERMQQNKVPFLYNYSPHVVPPPLDYSDWVKVTGYWFLDEGSEFEPPPDLSAFIARARSDGKKLVYIGFGSIVVADPAALTRTVVEAVLKADVRCILSKGWSDRLGDPAAQKVEVTLPAEIFQIKSAPHDWLFAQIDAAVHHGGAGTTGASLRAGLPTITKPFFGDQFFFGSRLEDLGVGICLKRINVSVLGKAIWEAVHSERMILKARMVGQQIRAENGVQTAIQAIYRDLEYAQTLIRARNNQTQGLIDSGEEHSMTAQDHARSKIDVDDEDEESWTFVEDSEGLRPRAEAGMREAGVGIIGRC